MDDIADRLEACWDLGTGFLGRLRERVFDDDAHWKLKAVLEDIS